MSYIVMSFKLRYFSYIIYEPLFYPLGLEYEGKRNPHWTKTRKQNCPRISFGKTKDFTEYDNLYAINIITVRSKGKF